LIKKTRVKKSRHRTYYAFRQLHFSVNLIPVDTFVNKLKSSLLPENMTVVACLSDWLK